MTLVDSARIAERYNGVGWCSSLSEKMSSAAAQTCAVRGRYCREKLSMKNNKQITYCQ